MSNAKRYLLSTGKILEVSPQEDAESPDDWCDDERFLVYNHRDFTIERSGFYPEDINTILESNKLEGTLDNEDIVIAHNNLYDDYHIFPVYAYIHSGVSLSLNRGSDRWDTSMKGFILVKKKVNNIVTTPYPIDEAKLIAEGLIETWNTYLSGDVYLYDLITTTKCSTCNHVEETIDDSCGGFYGDDINTNGILDNVEGTIIKEL